MTSTSSGGAVPRQGHEEDPEPIPSEEPEWKKAARVHVHPEDHDTDDEDEFDDYDEKKFYFAFQYGMTMFFITAISIAASAPQWLVRSDGKAKHYNMTTNMTQMVPLSINSFLGEIPTKAEYNIWAHCHCYASTEEICPAVRKFFLGGKIISCIALGSEAIVIYCFGCIYAGFWRRRHRGLGVTACFFCYITAISLLVSFATFSSVYARTWCGERVRERGFISWIYGLRITEFIAMIPITAGVTYQIKKRSKRFGKTFLFLVSVVWCASLVSTIARAWIQTLDQTREIGLWSVCNCWISDCGRETSYFESMEAFSILSVVAMYLFLATYFLHISKWTQIPLVFAALVLMVIPLALFGAWYGDEFCGAESAKARGFTLSWPLFLYGSAFLSGCGVLGNLIYRWWHDVY